jgi:predicted amidophosphoribosyltransferase
VEDCWSALRASRRTQGLCQRCAEKWTKEQSCSDKVQLHVLEEVLEMFMLQDDSLLQHDFVDSQFFLTL